MIIEIIIRDMFAIYSEIKFSALVYSIAQSLSCALSITVVELKVNIQDYENKMPSRIVIQYFRDSIKFAIIKIINIIVVNGE